MMIIRTPINEENVDIKTENNIWSYLTTLSLTRLHFIRIVGRGQ